jgi:uncharacterized membrane protein YkoI
MRFGAMLPRAVLAALALTACSDGSSPGRSSDIRYEPPNTDFATELGLTPRVSPVEARAIAEQATGGTALGVDQESEHGELLYEVQVRTSDGGKEVEIRASDGGVVEIEAADDD